MPNKVTIDPTDDADRWRYVCPAGHRTWEATNHHYWCSRCSSSHDPRVDPEFEDLVDLKEDRVLARDEVELKGYKAKSV